MPRHVTEYVPANLLPVHEGSKLCKFHYFLFWLLVQYIGQFSVNNHHILNYNTTKHNYGTIS
jgi:hypothetical protein